MTENSANDKEKKPAPVGLGEPGTGPEIPEENEKIIAARKKSAPRLVERATALRAQSIGRPPEPKSSRRRRTLQDIWAKDAEIPYVKFEAAVRDFVCSLMERQDRMNAEIFYQINELSYRVGDLEQDRPAAGGGP